jgi:hypothetical protein
MLLSLLVFFFSSFGPGSGESTPGYFNFRGGFGRSSQCRLCHVKLNPHHPSRAEPPWIEDHAAPRDERLSLTAGACWLSNVGIRAVNKEINHLPLPTKTPSLCTTQCVLGQPFCSLKALPSDRYLSGALGLPVHLPENSIVYQWQKLLSLSFLLLPSCKSPISTDQSSGEPRIPTRT